MTQCVDDRFPPEPDEAQALYAEGLTTAQLATVLGVSRQRASALLREAESRVRLASSSSQ